MFKLIPLKSMLIKPLILVALLAGGMCDLAYAGTQYKTPNGDVLNDPTRPHYWNKALSPKAKQKHFSLNYVLKTPQRTNAMINGQKVKEGGTVSGAKVLKINQNSVTILVNGQHRTLYLSKGGSIRK